MRNRFISLFLVIQMVLAAGLLSFLALPDVSKAASSADYTAKPPFVAAGVPPLLMLVMGRNHNLYYEAYNDASDLNNDGNLDVGYNPEIDYYGYFDSYKYYQHSSDRFEPVGETVDKTALERVFVPQDAQSWGKEYRGITYDGYDIRDYTPLDLPAGASRHLFANTTLSYNGDPLLRVLENSVFRIWEWVAIERPVAGSQGNDGSGRRDITDNNVSGSYVDVTSGGGAGVADDSYSAGSGILFEDDFDDESIDDASWSFVDHDSTAGTDHSETGGQLIIDANGADVYGGNDEFAALYQDDVSGDFDCRVRVTHQEDTNEWAKCGIMVRNDMTQPGLSTGYAIVSVTPGNGFSFQADKDDDGSLEAATTAGSASPPITWVRLTRVGNTFTGYYSTDGTSWIELESETIGSGSAVAAQDLGLFVSSHSSGELCEVHFDEMELLSGVDPIPENAFDDDADTQWQYPDEPAPGSSLWIEFAFDSDVEIKAYTINGGSDAPDSWQLMGSNDQSSWDTVGTVKNAGLNDGSTESFNCDSSDIYKYYRFVITDTNPPSPDGFSIREIEMMESTEPIPAAATLTDYDVRVAVCDPSAGLEPNSKLYPDGIYKPVGILQRHGESERMYFGLVTGSYTNNTSGGVLRKNIGPVTDEIDPDTGEFLYQDDSSVDGIIMTIDLFRIVDFDYGSHSYNANCGWIVGGPIEEGECRMWGNPIAEMMYESLRYFSGAASPTGDFTYGGGSNDDNDLGLPAPTWVDPYDEENGYDYCAKPFMLVLSDIYPTYDSDQLPGSAFGTVGSSLSGLNVESLAGDISAEEGGFGTHFIGEAGTYDGSCSPKPISGLDGIRGLCPEEPTKQGSYYAASVAYHGNTKDIHTAAQEDQKVGTYAVGLASPLPEINIEVGDSTITLVPFGKSVGGHVGGNYVSSAEGDFQPTNTIVDFFVEEITPTFGKFRINFEDVEQGADHDMDYSADVVYFGTVQGDSSAGWGGKLRRIAMDNDVTAASWDGDSTLIDLTGLEQPLTAAASAAMDNRGKRWVYFGTGRFFVNRDKENLDQQSYYGVIEPFNVTNGNGYMEFGEDLTWDPVNRADLLDVTNAEVFDDRSVSNVSGASTWEELINSIDSSATAGWFADFNEGPADMLDAAAERNLGQAALLGEMLTFTTYMPSTDVCTAAGESNLYALYYKTGTAYFEHVIGKPSEDSQPKQVDKVMSLGGGLAVSPNIHVGSEEGSKAFVQTSKGDIQVVQEINPDSPKSGIRSWREME